MLQAPTVWRAEFDCRSSPTITMSGFSAMRARQAELEVAQLVAAEGDAGEVVALDEDAAARRAPGRGSAPRPCGVGRMAIGDARDPGDPGADVGEERM